MNYILVLFRQRNDVFKCCFMKRKMEFNPVNVAMLVA